MFRGVIRKIKDTVAQVETAGGNILESVRLLQNYGFASHPEEGTEVLLAGGLDNALVIVASDRRYRIPLKPGEVAIYHKGGDSLVFRDGNLVELKTKTLKLNTEKCSLTNAQGELLALISETLGVLGNSQVATMMGPQPLSGAPEVQKLKLKIDSFLEGKNAQ